MNPIVTVMTVITFAWCLYDIIKSIKDKIDKHK